MCRNLELVNGREVSETTEEDLVSAVDETEEQILVAETQQQTHEYEHEAVAIFFIKINEEKRIDVISLIIHFCESLKFLVYL